MYFPAVMPDNPAVSFVVPELQDCDQVALTMNS